MISYSLIISLSSFQIHSFLSIQNKIRIQKILYYIWYALWENIQYPIWYGPYHMAHMDFKARLNILQSVDLFLQWLLQVQLFSPSKPKYHPIECYLRFLVDKGFEDFEMDFVSFYYFDDFSFLFEFSILTQFRILTDEFADNLIIRVLSSILNGC